MTELEAMLVIYSAALERHKKDGSKRALFGLDHHYTSWIPNASPRP